MKPIRRSQAITPFGPGAIVDFPGPVSLIHAGIDAWPFDRTNTDHREFMITDEPRLAHRLGVEYFVIPPDYRQPQNNSGQKVNLNLKLPFLRFPRWHVCPIASCGKMHYGEYHDRDAPKCTGRSNTNSHNSRKTFQVRFVVACPKGHLTDFPWVEWVFNGKQGAWKPDGADRWLTLKSSGSASLSGVQIWAEQLEPDGKINVVAKRSLAGVFTSTELTSGAYSEKISALSSIGITCNGTNPVLATGTEQRPALGCGEQLHTILKNTTSIYFPNVVSSIYIPEIDDTSLSHELLELLDDRDMKSEMRGAARGSDNGLVSSRFTKQLLSKYHPESKINPDDLANAANTHLLPSILLDDQNTMNALNQRYKINDGSLSEGDLQAVLDKLDWAVEPSRLLPVISRHFDIITGKMSDYKNIVQPTTETADEAAEEDAYRRSEYRVFTRENQSGLPKRDLDIRNCPIQEYKELVGCNFQRITLLHKLRETRVFDGFSRIYSSGISRKERHALFSESKVDWLPAIIVRGEGIFIEFSHAHIAKWELTYAEELGSRMEPLCQHLAKLAERRQQSPPIITPRYLLLHTFAHILITELVQECGYGSASLRERIYSGTGADPMSGVLIYTSAGDSEGTMGGLVRMGEPDRFGAIVINAINQARWCSADPICIESRGQGPGNCNLAACHSCALLPETSCEAQNHLLDRAMLVGTLKNPELGYFFELLQ